MGRFSVCHEREHPLTAPSAKRPVFGLLLRSDAKCAAMSMVVEGR
jgi:hypothetical protein